MALAVNWSLAECITECLYLSLRHLPFRQAMIKMGSCSLQCGTLQLLLAVSLCAPSSKVFATVRLGVLLQKEGQENLLLGRIYPK